MTDLLQEAREALAPFAKILARIDEDDASTAGPGWDDAERVSTNILVGTLRRAAAVLAKLNAAPSDEWLPIETAATAFTGMSYMVTYFDTSAGEWVVTTMTGAPNRHSPWTYWRQLPAPPSAP